MCPPRSLWQLEPHPWDSIRFNRPRPPFAKTSAPGQTHEALAARQRFLSQLNAHHQEALSAAPCELNYVYSESVVLERALFPFLQIDSHN